MGAGHANCGWAAFWEKARRLCAERWFVWTLIAIGAALRLRQYFADSPLWLDESYLAINLVERSFAGLFQPLEFNQTAPIGFLMLEKLAATLFGAGEYSLRLVPLGAGLAGLWLFSQVARRLLDPAMAAVALLFFVFSERLIYYSAEVKQYSCEVAMGLLLALGFLKVSAEPITARRTAAMAVLGALALWFSHPATFILGAIGLTLAGTAVIKRDWKRLAALGAAGAVWAASFAALYAVSFQHSISAPVLQQYWASAFMPMPPWSAKALRWLWDITYFIFHTYAGFHFGTVAVLLMLLGIATMFRAAPGVGLILCLPVALALLASALRKYPFTDRLLLFALPAIFLFITAGIGAVRERLHCSIRWAWAALPALLLYFPLTMDISDLSLPNAHEDARPALQYVVWHRQADDVLYLYHGVQPQCGYYFIRWGISNAQCVVGSDSLHDFSAYKRDLLPLAGKRRVWAVFSHMRKWPGVDEEGYILSCLNDMGERKDQIVTRGSSAYLYDLSARPDPHSAREAAAE